MMSEPDPSMEHPDRSGQSNEVTGGLAAVMHDNRAAIIRFLAARSGNPDLALDLYQELWLRLAHARPGPIDNAKSYIFRAASNLVLDHRRAELRTRRREGAWLETDNPLRLAPEILADPAVPADEAIALGQELGFLRQAIDALPPGARKALQLHRIGGLPHAEVAAAMGISRSGVEKHIALAMKHLRRAFANWGGKSSATSGEVEANDRWARDETGHD